jgi:hypothetical protein
MGVELIFGRCGNLINTIAVVQGARHPMSGVPRIRGCGLASADRPAHDSPQIPDSPAGFPRVSI